jgi:hypothetical protein
MFFVAREQVNVVVIAQKIVPPVTQGVMKLQTKQLGVEKWGKNVHAEGKMSSKRGEEDWRGFDLKGAMPITTAMQESAKFAHGCVRLYGACVFVQARTRRMEWDVCIKFIP